MKQAIEGKGAAAPFAVCGCVDGRDSEGQDNRGRALMKAMPECWRCRSARDLAKWPKTSYGNSVYGI